LNKTKVDFMIIAAAPHSTLRLLTTGPVAGWIGAFIWIASAAFVLRQLRRDLARVKQTRLTKWLLPAVRLSIVTLIAWLLCQPLMLIQRHWTPPAQMLIVTDSGNSMRVNEGAGDVTEQMDALDAAANQLLAKRNGAASRGARACVAIGRATSVAAAALTGDLDSAATGLPLGPSVARALDTVAGELRRRGDELISARAQLPPDAGDKRLKQSLADLASAWQIIGAAIDGIIADGPVVGREASKSPALLDAYLVRLKKLGADAESAHQQAVAVQAALDRTLLTAQDIAALLGRPLTRQALAEMAADRLSAPKSDGPSWLREQSSSLTAALDRSFADSLASPLAGVILLSDGSSPSPIETGAGSTIARLRIPVGTILIGADGVEPADAGLLAVEAPRVALAGDSITLRCLVKNLLAAAPAPKLVITNGKAPVAARELAVTKNGYDTVEFSWTPAAAGRTQLSFRIESAQPDAYPGNESSAAVVDVIASKARVLIVSDRLTGDFAAVWQILSSMPAVDAHVIVAAPGLSKFRVGSDAGEFPATVADFKSLSMIALIGDVPENAGAETISALKQAIEAGLRVWVQTPAADRSTRSWDAALGIESKPIIGRQYIEPIDDLWLDLYQLGRETGESAAAWKALAPSAGLSEIVTPGIGLLTAAGRPVLTLLPRKAGAAIVSGISDFTALRGAANGAAINRLLAQTLTIAIAPIGEPGQPSGAGLFPPQPISGKNLFILGEASNIKGLVAAGARTLAGAKEYRVTDSQTVELQLSGAALDRAVRTLVSQRDFQLAAHDAPLAKIAAETGGRHCDLFSAMDAVPPGLSGTPRTSATRIALWPGPWSLIVILALVSAEYLLRRRAGKVM
jgi:hypothetical protein